MLAAKATEKRRQKDWMAGLATLPTRQLVRDLQDQEVEAGVVEAVEVEVVEVEAVRKGVGE